MTSSEETSSPSCLAEITLGIKRALTGFLNVPNDGETRNAVYNSIATVLEVEMRKVVAENLKVEIVQDSVLVTLGGPLARLINDLSLPQVLEALEPYQVKLPGWKEEEVVDATRPYIDAKTQRPTRGRPL